MIEKMNYGDFSIPYQGGNNFILMEKINAIIDWINEQERQKKDQRYDNMGRDL